MAADGRRAAHRAVEEQPLDPCPVGGDQPAAAAGRRLGERAVAGEVFADPLEIMVGDALAVVVQQYGETRIPEAGGFEQRAALVLQVVPKSQPADRITAV